MPDLPERSPRCADCPCSSAEDTPCAARPATVRLTNASPSVSTTESNQRWATVLSENAPVHLVALFRDPGIVSGRSVQTVLDLHKTPDGLRAGRNCWVDRFLSALGPLPSGLTVALDNGVRCPYSKSNGPYQDHARLCVAETRHWHASLRHPDGGRPGILICDRDLARAYANLGLLVGRDGKPWRCPPRFVEAVGEELTLAWDSGETYPALLMAHPVLFIYGHADAYRSAFRDRRVAEKAKHLARLPAGPE